MRTLLLLLLAAAGIAFAAPVSDEARGTGFIDTPPANGDIQVPAVVKPTDPYLPQRKPGNLHGPVRGVRTYEGNRRHLQLVSVEEYDHSGRLIRQERYQGGKLLDKTTITFSPRGNRSELTVGEHYRRLSGYDARGRHISDIDYKEKGNTILATESFGYDVKGRQLTHSERIVGREGTFTVNLLSLSGKILRTTVYHSDGSRSGESYRYDERGRIVDYQDWYGNGVNLTATWRYTDTETTQRVEKNLTDRPIEVYRYMPDGRPLEWLRYGWHYSVVAADGSVTNHDTPYQEMKGEPPLYQRVVYSYEKNRLASIEYFDGAGQPAFQQMPLSHGGGGCIVLPENVLIYTTIRYTYDADGTPHWAAYDAKGQLLHHPFFTEKQPEMTVYISSPGTLTYTFLIGKPKYTFDRYGNWTIMHLVGKKGIRDIAPYQNERTVRKISYY